MKKQTFKLPKNFNRSETLIDYLNTRQDLLEYYYKNCEEGKHFLTMVEHHITNNVAPIRVDENFTIHSIGSLKPVGTMVKKEDQIVLI